MIALFSPKSLECAVNITWLMLDDDLEDWWLRTLIDRDYRNLDDLLASKGITHPVASKQIFFGHAISDGSALESYNGKKLGPQWWSRRFDLSIFHVCYGAKYFSNSHFDELLQDWVSYRDELLMICGKKEVTQIWKRVFLSMVKSIEGANNSQQLKKSLESIYEDAQDELDELPSGGLGQLAMSHMEWAMESMVTKLEMKQTN